MILGLGTYFLPVNALSKKNRATCHGIRNPSVSKGRFYVARLIKLNEYLIVFSRENISDKICVTDLNEIMLNSMPNS